MASISIEGDELVVRLTRAEKLWTLRRDLRVPMGAVSAVEVVPDGLRAVHGFRSPGLGIPGRRKCGTFRQRGHKALASVRAGQPAVRVALVGAPYDSVVVGMADAAARAAVLTALRS